MSESSRQIHDMIQTFDLSPSPELMASQILDILDAINRRMDEIDSSAHKANNIASCLANGIQPD